MSHYDVLIVGAGQGGVQAAISLRQLGFAGSLAMVGDEPELPYHRPPLSKDYLAGAKPFEQILIRPQAFWDQQKVEMLRGRRVVMVDAAGHSVTTQDGAKIGYGSLIWAAGGSPRRLGCAGNDLAGVHGVRSRADVDRMMNELAATREVVVIGGGYIGLETAAVLSKIGKRVTVLEALDRVLARVTGELLSRFYEAEHRAHGVDIRLGAQVDCIVGENGRATRVRMADGSVLPAQMVVVGIGILPATAPLIEAGAAGSNGVDVGGQCRTSLADVFAVGDLAAHESRFGGGARIRLESVQNAKEQATVVAKTLIGLPAQYDAVPLFWSNQYDLRLQTVGLSAGHDEVVVRGAIGARSFSVIYLKGGRVIALDCVNAAKDFTQGRALVAEGLAPAKERLACADTPLNS